MQGASPLASPGAEPARHLQNLPLCFPVRGFAPCGAGMVAFRYPAGGVAVLVARLPFTLALFLPPSPRPPSQREGGDSKFSYARGFAPCIPGAEPARHLQNLPSRCPEWGFAPCGAGMGGVPVPGGGQGGLPPCGTGSPCPGGEDHLKRRSSSPPVPPLLGCRHCPKESISVALAPRRRHSFAGHLLGRFCKCRRRSNAGDARGEAPCIK